MNIVNETSLDLSSETLPEADSFAARAAYREITRELCDLASSDQVRDDGAAARGSVVLQGHRFTFRHDEQDDVLKVCCASRNGPPDDDTLRQVLGHCATDADSAVIVGLDPASGECEARLSVSLWNVLGAEQEAAIAIAEHLIAHIRRACEEHGEPRV